MDRARDPDFAQRLFGDQPAHRLALMRAAWPAAVGADIARRAEVVAIDRNVLRIKVPDPRWQRTLLRMRGDILSRLRAVAGDAAPRGLGFVIGPVSEAPGPAPVPPAAAARVPRPVPAGVAEAAERITDPELRARFLDAASLYFARFGEGQESGGGSGSAGG